MSESHIKPSTVTVIETGTGMVDMTQPEPPPVPSDQPAIQDLVMADLAERKRQGIAKYGTALQAFNGRRPLVDAYQESLDQSQYLRQAQIEWDAMVARIEALEALLRDGMSLSYGLESNGIQAWRRHVADVLEMPLANHVARHGGPDPVLAVRRERIAAEAAIGAAAPVGIPCGPRHNPVPGLAAVKDPAQRARMAKADVKAWMAAHPVSGAARQGYGAFAARTPGGDAYLEPVPAASGDAEVPCRYCGEGMSAHSPPTAVGARYCAIAPLRCPTCSEFAGDHVGPVGGDACHIRPRDPGALAQYQPSAAAAFESIAPALRPVIESAILRDVMETTVQARAILGYPAPDVAAAALRPMSAAVHADLMEAARRADAEHGPIEVELKLALAQFGQVPAYKSADAAGMDVCAAIGVERTIEPGQRWRMKLGVHLEIPLGYFGKIDGRSGLFDQHGLVILSGTIDPDYRGEVAALMMNLGDKPVTIKPGERIAQLILHRRVHATVKVVARQDLSDTARGARGFGSTGR